MRVIPELAQWSPYPIETPKPKVLEMRVDPYERNPYRDPPRVERDRVSYYSKYYGYKDPYGRF